MLLKAHVNDYEGNLKYPLRLEGLYTASVFFAFVLEDFINREKKINEAIYKIHTIYDERKSKYKDYDQIVSQACNYFATHGRPDPTVDASKNPPKYYNSLKLFLNYSTLNESQGTHYYEDELFVEPKKCTWLQVGTQTQNIKYPTFFDLPLDADAKTIKEMDDLILNIEALLVHEISLVLFYKPEAVANCFSRSYQGKSSNDYDRFSQEVHWLPKSDKVQEDIYQNSHNFLLKNLDPSLSIIRASLKKSDINLMDTVCNLSSSAGVLVRASIASDTKELFLSE